MSVSHRATQPLGVLLTVFALALVPWTIHLANTLPARQLSPHYRAAWVGFDIALLLMLAWTGLAAYRGSPRLSTAASAAGTLMLVDAWFDVTTSASRADARLALVTALMVEVPLAVVCFWLSRRPSRAP